MKKVPVEGQIEAEFECDHCGKDAHGQLSIHFWYGSKYDLTQGTVYLCDPCADNLIKILKQNFNINIEMKDITEL